MIFFEFVSIIRKIRNRDQGRRQKFFQEGRGQRKKDQKLAKNAET